MVKKRGMPKYNENVLCTVTRITPFAAWCNLDEYEDENGNSIEGMIHISQVAGRWVKDIRKYVKQNKQYVAKVIRIDREKGHLNLSLKRITKFEKREKLESFRRNKRGNAMLLQAAKRIGKTAEDAQKEVAPNLQDYDDIFSAFEHANEDPDVLKEAGISKPWRDAITEVIEQNFKLKERKLQANLELMTDAEDGIEKIRKILSDIEKEVDGEVKYISAPHYLVEIISIDPKEDEKKLKGALEKAIESIEKIGGEGNFEFIR